MFPHKPVQSALSHFPNATFIEFMRLSSHRLFVSVATRFKERVIAVVFTGSDDDGIVGVQAIKNMGGGDSVRRARWRN